MIGRHILTDKNHFMAETEIFKGNMVSRANTLKISEEAKSFKGFGVALTGSSCYNLNAMDKEKRQAFLKTIYGKNGLGLSVARLTVGASDYSAFVYSYDDVPFDTELKHFSIGRDEEYIIPMIKEILEINPDLFLYASPWSPPGWMKTGGSMCGGYMREEFIGVYADYIIKFLKAYEEKGIKISALTPQNEPGTDQNGQMPACIWHPETEAKFIKILKNKLTENGLPVEIWMHDHNFSDTEKVLWSLRNIEGLKEAVSGVAFHYYVGTIEETLKIKREFQDLSLNFTEGGPRLYDKYDSDWCKWGVMISKAIKCGYNSFTGWNLMLDERGGPNVGPFLCGGLITRNSVSGELSFSGQYKALWHIAKYINENSLIYPVYVGEEYNLSMGGFPASNMEIEGFMIDNGDGKKIFVLINPNGDKRQIQFNLDGDWWYGELSPDSISTIIIE